MFRIVALIVAIVSFLPASATAKIKCKGQFQIIRGFGLHASPYCEIKELAKVARHSYGISTSFQRLRHSNSERERICRAIGHDHRISNTCHEYRNENNRLILR